MLSSTLNQARMPLVRVINLETFPVTFKPRYLNTLSSGGGAWWPEIQCERHMSDVGYLAHRPIWDTTSVSAGQSTDKTSIFEHKVIKLRMEVMKLEESNQANKNKVRKRDRLTNKRV